MSLIPELCYASAFIMSSCLQQKIPFGEKVERKDLGKNVESCTVTQDVIVWHLLIKVRWVHSRTLSYFYRGNLHGGIPPLVIKPAGGLIYVTVS